MPVLEQSSQSPLDDHPAKDAAEKAQGRFVIDIVDENCAVRMRFDDVPVMPASKWTPHLLVFE